MHKIKQKRAHKCNCEITDFNCKIKKQCWRICWLFVACKLEAIFVFLKRHMTCVVASLPIEVYVLFFKYWNKAFARTRARLNQIMLVSGRQYFFRWPIQSLTCFDYFVCSYSMKHVFFPIERAKWCHVGFFLKWGLNWRSETPFFNERIGTRPPKRAAKIEWKPVRGKFWF